MQTGCGLTLAATSEGFAMAIKKLDDGRFEVDIRPCGREGRRTRRRFDRKTEAIAFERYVMVNANKK